MTLVLDTYNDISIMLCNDMKSAAWKNTRVHFSNRCDLILLHLYSKMKDKSSIERPWKVHGSPIDGPCNGP